jgi:hypothetical protein
VGNKQDLIKTCKPSINAQYEIKLVKWKSITEHKWTHPSLSQSAIVTDKLQKNERKEHSGID